MFVCSDSELKLNRNHHGDNLREGIEEDGLMAMWNGEREKMDAFKV